MKQLLVWFVGYLVGSTLVGAADTIITGLDHDGLTGLWADGTA